MLSTDEVILLLGAGASYDAGIPISSKMISNVEELIKGEWVEYKNLYYCLKSSIHYGFGIAGEFSSGIINIETLVNTMDELIKGYDNPLYPFVGSWTPRLAALAGTDFIEIKRFKNEILKKLSTDWMHLDHEKDASLYYGKIIDFQKIYGHPLHIFSLNYDKCIEIQCTEIGINRGFNNNHIWDWKNFVYDEATEDGIYLYKLHGSIDWAWTSDGFVEEVDKSVYGDDSAIIFGTSYKLQYLDPFLFLVYEFRRRTLENTTKIILCIGYSFNDEHINGILGQSLKADNERIIIAVYPLFGKKKDEVKNGIREKLKLKNISSIHIIDQLAKDFFTSTFSTKKIEEYRGKDSIPF
jgi:hypothetical protein